MISCMFHTLLFLCFHLAPATTVFDIFFLLSLHFTLFIHFSSTGPVYLYVPYHLIQKFSLNSTHTMYLLDSNALTISRLSNILAVLNACIILLLLLFFFHSILSRYLRWSVWYCTSTRTTIATLKYQSERFREKSNAFQRIQHIGLHIPRTHI